MSPFVTSCNYDNDVKTARQKLHRNSVTMSCGVKHCVHAVLIGLPGHRGKYVSHKVATVAGAGLARKMFDFPAINNEKI